jgi:spore coat protein U-like protein
MYVEEWEMKGRKRLMMALVASVGFPLLAMQQAQAAIAGKIEARLEVEDGCEVTGGSKLDGGINDFGTLDFGKSAPLWDNNLAATLAAAPTVDGQLEVTCSPSVGSFTVAIDGGKRNDRTLQSGSETIAYSVFRNTQRTDEYVNGLPQTFTVDPAGAPVPVPIYGAIAPNSTARSSGIYTDTLMVTIDF